MTTLYNLHTDGDQFRITKFVDGEVESSYICNTRECECPAGHRTTCRHRQMLPVMLANHITDTHWFYNFDTHRVVDFNGELKSNLDALHELAAQRVDMDYSNGIGHGPAYGIMGAAQHVEEDIPASYAQEAIDAEADYQAQALRKPWRRL